MVHNVFHVQQLWKCLKTPDEPISHEELDRQSDLTYVEKPSKRQKIGKNSRIEQLSIAKSNRKTIPREKLSWEKEEKLRKAYPELFTYTTPQLRDEVFFKEGRLYHPTF
jgi:hypothetical protein